VCCCCRHSAAMAASGLRSGTNAETLPQQRHTMPQNAAEAGVDRAAEQLEAVVTKTLRRLREVLPRPRATRELLRRPPFRFMHDIVSAITAETGFAAGLFDHVESDAVQIRSQRGKMGKLAYFQKLVTYVAIVMRIRPPALPSKIICGKQPIRTNALLQVYPCRALASHRCCCLVVTHACWC